MIGKNKKIKNHEKNQKNEKNENNQKNENEISDEDSPFVENTYDDNYSKHEIEMSNFFIHSRLIYNKKPSNNLIVDKYSVEHIANSLVGHALFKIKKSLSVFNAKYKYRYFLFNRNNISIRKLYENKLNKKLNIRFKKVKNLGLVHDIGDDHINNTLSIKLSFSFYSIFIKAINKEQTMRIYNYLLDSYFIK